MYERFTDRARKVMQLANQEAQRFNHEYIGTEHILLGLVKEGTGVAANVLKNLNVKLHQIQQQIEKIVQAGPDMLTMGKLPQTPRAKKVVEYAIEEARNLNHNYVGTEHLLLGLLREQEGVAAQVLMNLGVRLDVTRVELLQLLGYNTAVRPGNAEARFADRRKGNTPTLDVFGWDLTELARQGRLIPLVGRDAELQALTDVLSCRDKCNPVILGEAGVGKTALVAGLAHDIVARHAPAWLEGCRIVELSFSRFWFGVPAKTALAQLRSLVVEAKQCGNVILYLPRELSAFAGARAGRGANALRLQWLDAMQGAHLSFILSGRPPEYRRCLRRQIALDRFCQPVHVPPTTREQTAAILRTLCDRYESHHGVRYTPEALAAIAPLAEQHLPGALPGKALLLLDRAGARGRHKGPEPSWEACAAAAGLEERIEELHRAKEQAVAETDFVRAAELRDQADQLKCQRESIVSEDRMRGREQRLPVDVSDVEAALRDLTGGMLPGEGLSARTGITRRSEPEA